jgi:hypothetical protein
LAIVGGDEKDMYVLANAKKDCIAFHFALMNTAHAPDQRD